MLQELREKTKSWIAYVIIGLLILSFALWGISSYLGGGSVNNAAATVNGEEISQRQLQQAYDQNQRFQQLDLGADYSQHPEFQNALRQQTLNSLITNVALNQYLKQSKFRVSIDDAENAIYHLDVFSEDGVFSPDKYKRYLSATISSDAQFVRQFQSSMVMAQLRSGLMTSNFSLPNEVAQSAALIQQKRQIEYAILDNTKLASVSVSDDDVLAYYNAHKDEYKLPEEVKVAYILLTPENFLPKESPTSSELESYYRNNISQFSAPNSEEIPAFDSIKDKVKVAYLANVSGKAYAKAIDTVTNLSYEQPDSLEPAAKAIGLKVITTGFISQAGGEGILSNKAFLSAAFSDDVLVGGNNSDVIQIDSNTSAVLRVMAHKSASFKPLSEVREQIVKQIQQLNTEKAQLTQADQIIQSISSGDNLDKVASKYSLQFTTTAYLGRFSKSLDESLITDAFMKSSQPSKTKAYKIKLSTGDVAVYLIVGVKPGVVGDDKEVTLANYQQQIVEESTMSEYALLVEGIINRAKVKVT